MSENFSWDKPVRFAMVQGDDHVRYKPQIVGSYLTPEGARRWMVAIRNWDNAPSFALYDDDGKLLNKPETSASGIFDANVVNGAEIKTIRRYLPMEGLGGVNLKLTLEGGKPVRVELA